MADTVQAQLRGGKALADSLRELPRKLRNKLCRPALRAGAKLVRQQAKANVNSISGETRRSIKVSIRVKGQTIIAIIGPRPDNSKGKDAFYMGWEDAGHFTGNKVRKIRLTRGESRQSNRDYLYKLKSVAAGRTWVKGTFFMERAIETRGAEATQVVVDKLRTSIEATKLN